MTHTDASSLTAEDRDFLRRPLHGVLSVAGGPEPPQPRPVCFEATAEVARLCARHWDLADPARADELAGMLAADWVRVVIHPETVRRYIK